MPLGLERSFFGGLGILRIKSVAGIPVTEISTSSFSFLLVKRRPVFGLDGLADIDEFGFAPRQVGDAAGRDVDEGAFAADLDAHRYRSVGRGRGGTDALGRI